MIEVDMDERKNSIYAQATSLMQEDTEESLQQAMALFASIRGWRDADRQSARCRTRQNRKLWQKEYAQLKAEEDQYTARVARRKKIGIIALTALLLIAVVTTAVSLHRFWRYSHAVDCFMAGEYKRAAETFQAMDGYKDSRLRVYHSAVGMYRVGQYEEALSYFLWLDGDYDNGYHIKRCYERLEGKP